MYVCFGLLFLKVLQAHRWNRPPGMEETRRSLEAQQIGQPSIPVLPRDVFFLETTQ